MMVRTFCVKCYFFKRASLFEMLHLAFFTVLLCFSVLLSSEFSWHFMCLVRASFLVKPLFWQLGWLQKNLFSPVWLTWWRFRSCGLLKGLPQVEQGNRRSGLLFALVLALWLLTHWSMPVACLSIDFENWVSSRLRFLGGISALCLLVCCRGDVGCLLPFCWLLSWSGIYDAWPIVSDSKNEVTGDKHRRLCSDSK